MYERLFGILVASALCLGACTPASTPDAEAVTRGQSIFAQECAQCHGTQGNGAGPAGVAAPDLTELTQRNQGVFPREFVRRFVLGLLEKDDPQAAMPEFSQVGLRHVYPDGGADGEVLEADFEDLLDYIESIQN